MYVSMYETIRVRRRRMGTNINTIFLTQATGIQCDSALKMFEEQMSKLEPPVTFTRTSSHVPSFMEKWCFYQVTRQPSWGTHTHTHTYTHTHILKTYTHTQNTHTHLLLLPEMGKLAVRCKCEVSDALNFISWSSVAVITTWGLVLCWNGKEDTQGWPKFAV